MTPRTGGGPNGQTPRSYRPSTNKNGRLPNNYGSSRPFKIGHQRVNVDIDLSNNSIEGFTEITVLPFIDSLRSIKLDCREISIKDIYINNSRNINYIYNDKLFINDEKNFDNSITKGIWNIFDIYSDDITIHQHHMIRQRLNYIFREFNYDSRNTPGTEELIIIFPDNLRLELTDLTSITTPGSLPGTTTPLHLKSKSTLNEIFTPINIKIEYELINPNNGINFFTNSDNKNLWHAYTTNSDYNISTSSWVPCLDNLWDRCTWSIEVNVPRTVKDIGNPRIIGSKAAKLKVYNNNNNNNNNDNDNEDNQGSDIEDEDVDLSVCSGDFNNVKETPHPIDLSKKVVSWAIFNPVCSHHVGWAVGCFESFIISDISQPSELDEDTTSDEVDKEIVSSPITIYCLLEHLEMAKNTCAIVGKAVDYYSKEFGSFPFSSYSIVFIKDSIIPVSNFAGLSIFSDEILYPPNLIEPMFSSTEIISESISSQWSNINIIPQTFNDIWCTIGISRFMSFQFLRSLMGNNQYRYKIKQMIDQIVEQDIGKEPIGLQNFKFPVSQLDLSFIKLKAPIVLFILDKRMTKTDKSFGLSRVLPKLFLQAMSGDLPNGTLSTSHFQYTCEKVNRNKLENFFKEWVFGSGTPTFNVSQKFNKKRNVIEMSIRQVQHIESKSLPPNPNTFIKESISFLEDEPYYPIQTVFTGPMTIRVHEADGTPYEHIVDLKENHSKLDIHYNSKTRKKKKDDTIEPGSNFSKLGNVLQTKRDMEEWNFAEWEKREEDTDAFEWIRVDVDFEWIGKFIIKQPDYMYGAQLQYDRDVEAQIEATRYFARLEKPQLVHATVLTRTVMDSRYFYGVRIAAAKALANFSNERNNYFGLYYLIQIFQALFCFPSSTIPLSNDFNDFNKLFLQTEIVTILSTIRDENGQVPMIIKDLLLNLLKYNDNSNNVFRDDYYVANLLISLTDSLIGDIPISFDTYHINKASSVDEIAIKELERIQKLDEWIPSYQQIISITTIRQKIKLAIHSKLIISFENLIYYTTPKFSYNIRLEAFKGLLILGGLKNKSILNYFLTTCLVDISSSKFRSNLITILIESISIVALQGSPISLDDPEFNSFEKLSGLVRGQGSNMIIIDNDSSQMDSRRDALARATIDGAIVILRRDYSIGNGLKNILWELIHSSLISLHDKRNIFLICDILYEEIDQFNVRIPIPSLPITEFNKKIIAKNIGNGKVIFKREGRFKLQLASRKISVAESKPKPKIPEIIDIKKEPKLKLNISLKPTEVKKKSLVIPPKPIVSIDRSHGLSVKVKFVTKQLSKLAPLRSIKAVKSHKSSSIVSINDSSITFKFKGNSVERYESYLHNVKPLRYIKIHLNNNKVEVSRTPFEQKQIQDTPSQDTQTKTVEKVKSEPPTTISSSRSVSPFTNPTSTTTPIAKPKAKPKANAYIHQPATTSTKSTTPVDSEKKPILKLKLSLKK
ncbi:uncharacterized protein RJT21DRAFT_82225 [Scheffersomyces amazonensis]|uniref:uncharacterized protein n=1 Tax=Scheffersomyces amazonensis TaxID=1078765 RepID=UPI00315D05CE